MASLVTDLINDPVVVPWGLTVLSLQIGLYGLFKYVCPDGPWKELPSFTAHQTIALGAMIYTTVLGFMYFERERGVFDVNEGGIFLAQFTMGTMLFWDIPTGLLSDGMGDPIMHAHHIGFFFVATIAMGYFSDGVNIGSDYAPFFFGMIELSSIPLAIVDVFHPKQKAWNAYLSKSKILETINELSRVAFALLYVAMRVIYFPYVTLGDVVPKFLVAVEEKPDLSAPLYAIIVLAVLFTFLQIYWGTLVVRQIVKALSGGGGDKADKKKN